MDWFFWSKSELVKYKPKISQVSWRTYNTLFFMKDSKTGVLKKFIFTMYHVKFSNPMSGLLSMLWYWPCLLSRTYLLTFTCIYDLNWQKDDDWFWAFWWFLKEYINFGPMWIGYMGRVGFGCAVVTVREKKLKEIEFGMVMTINMTIYVDTTHPDTNMCFVTWWHSYTTIINYTSA